ncbi:MAG: YkgJ family cysteine cluster protein, partial [Gammaproteobacteria bacterium]|nr:YkgJ family cysteine cluster protein [Gammaproteobacteria bacterium]
HCLGHFEPREQTVANYRHEQGIEKYDEMNHAWYEIILKKRSSGPTVGAPSQRSLQMFDMCSYDMDSFAQFIQSSGFQSIFAVSEEETRMLLEDEEKLLQFSMRFLKQVLYGETTIPVREKARERRTSERKEVWTLRKEEAVREWREQQEEDKYREG